MNGTFEALEIPSVYPLDGEEVLPIKLHCHNVDFTDMDINGHYVLIDGHYSNVLYIDGAKQASFSSRNVAIRGAVNRILDMDFPNDGPENAGYH
jgi:hypothetical protein